MAPDIPRKLNVLDDAGQSKTIDEAELATSSKPIVILAEPGMGKTWLMRRLGALPAYFFCSASRFVTLPSPTDLIGEGVTVLIDGLDELSAAQEADPINRVLGKLIESGCPPFILSCRAADWRGAVARQDIADAYGQTPRQMWLQRFGPEDAIAFLAVDVGRDKAETIIATLDSAGIPDLYGNPLSLKLFAALAAQTEIPKTRAELLARASGLMCREANDRRLQSGLSVLDTETALAAAGAISAAFVLTSSETVTRLPSTAFRPATLAIAEVAALPDAGQSQALLDSRLFTPVPEVDGAFKPIHRSVAEFLGARWLAASAKDDLACDRLLALLTIDGGVPASLRGIHAWLARDPRLAPRIIATDPYGIIAYGDADTLSVAHARLLLTALQKYQEANPYFRADDWKSYSAKSLTSLELLPDVRELILSKATTFHLRSLILGLIPDSPIAAPLAPDLKRILRNTDGFFSYSERNDAIATLARLAAEQADLKLIADELIAAGDEDATRLAIDIVNETQFTGYTADKLAEAIVAHLGMTDGKIPARSRTTSLFGISRNLPDALIADVLDALARRLPERDHYDAARIPFELETLVTHLVSRQLAMTPPTPLQLLCWLRMIAARSGYRADDQKTISDFIRNNDDLRHAMQRVVLFDEANKARPARIWHVSAIHPALSFSTDDIVHHLNDLATAQVRDPKAIAVWRDLAAYIRADGDSAPRMAAAARLFATGDPELEAHLTELLQPVPTPAWQIKQQERQAKHECEKAENRARNREQFGEHVRDIRAGVLGWIFPPAQAYLALYSDIDQKLPPPERIADWLGPELRDAALAGFEAVLRRRDLPSPTQVAEGYAEKKRWNFVLPMIAAVCERHRTRAAFDDIAPEVLLATVLALQNEPLGDRVDQRGCIRSIEAILRKDAVRFEGYVRLLIEPFLAAKEPHIMGLHALTRSQHDQPLAVRLAAEWLTAHAQLPVDVEAELIDVLVSAGDTATLQRLTAQRSTTALEEPARSLNWLAIRVLTDFTASTLSLTPLKPEDKQLLWHIRNFIGYERRKPHAGLAVAPELLAWIIGEFRRLWPRAHMPRSSWGDTNDWDATEFLDKLIKRLASDLSPAAADALRALATAPKDGYTDVLLYSLDAQNRARRERAFIGVTVPRLKDVLQSAAPRTTGDLLAIIRFALARLREELRGNDTDTVVKYWTDAGAPRDEDTCTDLLIEDLDRLMPVHGISRIPQRDMPQGKCADIAYTAGDAELPVECKGQWHRDLWTAASTQLDGLYVSNWRSQDKGLFVVYWFGPGVPSGKRLCPSPDKQVKPRTADELRQALTAMVPLGRRASIAIEVLDLTRRS